MGRIIMKLNLLLILMIYVGSSTQYEKSTGRHAGRKHSLKQKSLHRGKRAWVIDTFELEEELPGPYPKLIGTVKVEEDYQMRYRLTGKGVDEDPKGLFHINEDDGSIYVHRKVDFEQTKMFHWKFNAINKTSLQVGTKLGIQLKILDINDNAPQFSKKSYEVSVNESVIQGYTVYTVLAYDLDEEGSLNSRVDYRIVSQTPADSETEFTVDREKGFISFKGCLDYERNKNYKLVIEAKDNGAEIQQSSQCEVRVTVLDRNNHSPQWSSSQLQTEVPEREVNVTILRFGVSDGDTPYTPGWRAVYKLVSGNDDGNFQIMTDPKTNEGLLTVVKPLDYEKISQCQLSVQVVNEEPLHSCKILKKTLTGLWQLDNGKNQIAKLMEEATKSVVVDVLDVNDPPLFIPDKITISMQEHSMESGTVLGKVEAKDMDLAKPNKIKYVIENDTAGWLSMNEDTGVITAKAQMDRESEYVTNSNYVVKVLAVDDGVPSMTGTATLFISLKDINDNVPRLESPYLTTCYNEEEALISALVIDKDLDPYSGPFHFDVLDKDYEAKHLELIANSGDTLQIRKRKGAHQGNHTLNIEIYDRQGTTSLQKLTVYVCDCLDGDACVEKMSGPPVLGGSAIILLLLAIVLFLALSLLLCKFQTKKVMVPVDSEPLNSIIAYNEEGGNKDCQGPATLNENEAEFTSKNQNGSVEADGALYRQSARRFSSPAVVGHNKVKVMRSNSLQPRSSYYSANRHFDRATSQRHSSYHRGKRINLIDRGTAHRNSLIRGQLHSIAAANQSMSRRPSRMTETMLKQKLKTHVTDLDIYKPRVFADEGQLSGASSLETITIAGSMVNLGNFENLGSKFNILEDICAEHLLNRSKEKPST
ncbi:cadherin-like protein 26 [Spea bombifrons]|uniref:cadherin-like protein 26 n=1 Tax=Spea bombifrons TaxID=233779 RepID=UPI00234B214F|nr:cadherin-like protein 26 [Spea bombifrons]